MVAQTADPSPAATAPPERPGFSRRPNRGGIRRLVASTTRLADLQLRIWLTEAKLAVSRIMMYVALYAGAGVLGILAIIFLMIGFFKILTDVIGLRPVWAFLIYGALLAALAGGLVFMASSILKKSPKQDSAAEGKHHES